MTKVLFVDDEANLKKIFSIFVSSLDNIEYYEASNGAEGVESAKRNHPDLIIMDYKMPVMNGIEALRQIRNSVLTENIPVVMHTAFASDLDMDTINSFSHVEIVTKPVDIATWTQIIENHIK